MKSPADIGYDRKRGRVLVPLLTEDEVRIYGLQLTTSDAFGDELALP